MTVLPTILLTIYAALGLIYWLRIARGAVLTRRGVPRLSRVGCPAPDVWPRLSVVAPACDEADKIDAAARTLLAQDYPDLQIVLVDDRSTDATGEVIDRLAAADPRVRAVHIDRLPDGWLGKVNALNRGFAESDGEYVLFTDADVHFAPGALRRGMAYAVDRGFDHLAAGPDLWPATLVTDLLVISFLRQLFTLFIPPWRVSDPDSKAFFGVGAFNLVRREAFEATDGFEWLRMETGDDMGLGLMMKRSGARCGVVLASEQIGLNWYRTLGEAARGCEKAFASAANCRLSTTIIAAAICMLMELSPVLTLLPLLFSPTRWIGLIGLANATAFIVAATVFARWAGASIPRSLLTPLAAPISAAILLRAGVIGHRRGGIAWRGAFYPAAELRAGRRVKPGV